MLKFNGFGQAKPFDLNRACELISYVLFPGQCPSMETKFILCFLEWWSKVFLTSSGAYCAGNSKRKKDKGNTPQTKVLRIGAAISVTPISVIPIQSVPMSAKDPDEAILTPEPSPATTSRRKLKSIVVCTPNEQGTSNVQGSKLNYRKVIFPLQRISWTFWIAIPSLPSA
ncbi:hypothetical protein Cgig2_023338 [Carnegiea gigantea]|uniref:Uncharacterized protein n=1 Tax=Carnegiea gigantea TaxID=171969 RepID=A0A9Q1QBR6_9CARY|nr:hypothetical protein Cgig2_023338 [Carnegiea gigantea]